tara:strand:- start:1199 stop:1306 length:108 start_codon:yes stop_codon:yes gene_type:complete
VAVLLSVHFFTIEEFKDTIIDQLVDLAEKKDYEDE